MMRPMELETADLEVQVNSIKMENPEYDFEIKSYSGLIFLLF